MEQEENQENKIVKTKTYTITVDQFEDGSKHMKRVNHGFDPLELLGLSSFIQKEVTDQIQGHFMPDIVTRQVIVDEFVK
jgi:hypothetical protein